MRDNPKITILIGAVVFIIILSVVFVVNRQDPAFNELAMNSATEISSAEDFVPENTETINVSPAEGTLESTEDVQDVDAAVPTARTGLESTNPDTVKLASGDFQFVELFAFW